MAFVHAIPLLNWLLDSQLAMPIDTVLSSQLAGALVGAMVWLAVGALVGARVGALVGALVGGSVLRPMHHTCAGLLKLKHTWSFGKKKSL
jgi:hypothetical protein